MKTLKTIRRKIKAWIYTQKLRWKKRQEEIKRKKLKFDYIVATHKDDNENENKTIIPLENISLIYIEYIYDDEYNKYKPQKVIRLKDGRVIQVKHNESAIFSTKDDIETILTKMV